MLSSSLFVIIMTGMLWYLSLIIFRVSRPDKPGIFSSKKIRLKSLTSINSKASSPLFAVVKLYPLDFK